MNYYEKLDQMERDGFTIPQQLACIYDLYQDYRIDEPEEIDLYFYVDPDEEFNNVSEYWHEMDFENPLIS